MKQLVKKLSHTARSKPYEIEVYSDGANWEACATLNGRQVSATYSVSQPVDMDMKFYHGDWAHDHLEHVLRSDIDENRIAP